MGNSIGDILQKRGQSSNEPDEFLIIRKFVQDRYEVTPKLSISRAGIVIGVPNSAIAGNLRFDLYDIQQLTGSARRMIIRIIR